MRDRGYQSEGCRDVLFALFIVTSKFDQGGKERIEVVNEGFHVKSISSKHKILFYHQYLRRSRNCEIHNHLKLVRDNNKICTSQLLLKSRSLSFSVR